MTKIQEQTKIIKPKLMEATANNYIKLSEIKDEDSYKDVCICDSSLGNQRAHGAAFQGVIFRRVSFMDMSMNSLELTDVRFENCDYIGYAGSGFCTAFRTYYKIINKMNK